MVIGVKIFYYSDDLKDSSNHYNGTCTSGNCPSYAQGVKGYAAYFNGVNTFASLATAPQLLLNQSSFTVAAWINVCETIQSLMCKLMLQPDLSSGPQFSALLSTAQTNLNPGLHLTLDYSVMYFGFYGFD